MVADAGSAMTLDDWARRVGVCRRTHARLFEAETGLGFRDCRRQMQLPRSKPPASGASINETVYRCVARGFLD